MSGEQRTLPDFDHPLSEPSWLTEALQAVSRLGRLEEDWDGYGSPAVRQAALSKAISLLDALRDFNMPTAEISPVSGGGIGIAWQLHPRELEVEILPDGSAESLMVDEEAGERTATEGRLPANPNAAIQRLATWLING